VNILLFLIWTGSIQGRKAESGKQGTLTEWEGTVDHLVLTILDQLLLIIQKFINLKKNYLNCTKPSPSVSVSCFFHPGLCRLKRFTAHIVIS
jgi:hypothetical protein